MLLIRPPRKSICGLFSYRAAVMCLAALGILLAHGALASVSHSSLKVSVGLRVAHDQRQCFDHEDAQWLASSSATLSTGLSVVQLQPVRIAQPFVEIVTDGMHYNRPPPFSQPL